MKISGGIQEDGVLAGNTFDKYGSKNPLIKMIMSGFDRDLSGLVNAIKPTSIHEIGCGEGYWTLQWAKSNFSVRGTDFSETIVEVARQNALKHQCDPTIFSVTSIYDLDPGLHAADVIVCCEVLEHLVYPEKALTKLRSVTGRYMIISVPREPLWRILNMLSGRYLTAWGNTPGHMQHWSKTAFVRFVQQQFDVVETKTPLPWSMLLCCPKQ